MRRVLAFFREIDRTSRAVRRDGFDRARSVAFVLAFVASPFVVWEMQERVVVRERQDLMFIRVFRMSEDGEVKAQRVDADDLNAPWAVFMPMAEVTLVERSEWRGWPLTTAHTFEPTQLDVRLVAGCPPQELGQVKLAASRIVERSGLSSAAAVSQTHVAAWIFSAGIWWMLLSLAAAMVLVPIKLVVTLSRRMRNAVRQSRIDRCHCPNCDYDAKQSILMGRCPECGSELYERPDRS